MTTNVFELLGDGQEEAAPEEPQKRGSGSPEIAPLSPVDAQVAAEEAGRPNLRSDVRVPQARCGCGFCIALRQSHADRRDRIRAIENRKERELAGTLWEVETDD